MHINKARRNYIPSNEEILWDIDMKREFIGRRRTGYSFVIDLLDGEPRLALYRMKVNCSVSTTTAVQPPRNMLIKAIYEQGGHIEADNLYHINSEIRAWIEECLLSALS